MSRKLDLTGRLIAAPYMQALWFCRVTPGGLLLPLLCI